jgi:quercetin dioxygenase-like cupin family protein
VLEGAVVSQLDNEKPKTYTAGQIWSESPGQHHMISRNASATEPAALLVFLIIAHNAQLTVPIVAGH